MEDFIKLCEQAFKQHDIHLLKSLFSKKARIEMIFKDKEFFQKYSLGQYIKFVKKGWATAVPEEKYRIEISEIQLISKNNAILHCRVFSNESVFYERISVSLLQQILFVTELKVSNANDL